MLRHGRRAIGNDYIRSPDLARAACATRVSFNDSWQWHQAVASPVVSAVRSLVPTELGCARSNAEQTSCIMHHGQHSTLRSKCSVRLFPSRHFPWRSVAPMLRATHPLLYGSPSDCATIPRGCPPHWRVSRHSRPVKHVLTTYAVSSAPRHSHVCLTTE